MDLVLHQPLTFRHALTPFWPIFQKRSLPVVPWSHRFIIISVIGVVSTLGISRSVVIQRACDWTTTLGKSCISSMNREWPRFQVFTWIQRMTKTVMKSIKKYSRRVTSQFMYLSLKILHFLHILRMSAPHPTLSRVSSSSSLHSMTSVSTSRSGRMTRTSRRNTVIERQGSFLRIATTSSGTVGTKTCASVESKSSEQSCGILSAVTQLNQWQKVFMKLGGLGTLTSYWIAHEQCPILNNPKQFLYEMYHGDDLFLDLQFISPCPLGSVYQAVYPDSILFHHVQITILDTNQLNLLQQDLHLWHILASSSFIWAGDSAAFVRVLFATVKILVPELFRLDLEATALQHYEKNTIPVLIPRVIPYLSHPNILVHELFVDAILLRNIVHLPKQHERSRIIRAILQYFGEQVCHLGQITSAAMDIFSYIQLVPHEKGGFRTMLNNHQNVNLILSVLRVRILQHWSPELCHSFMKLLHLLSSASSPSALNSPRASPTKLSATGFSPAPWSNARRGSVGASSPVSLVAAQMRALGVRSRFDRDVAYYYLAKRILDLDMEVVPDMEHDPITRLPQSLVLVSHLCLQLQYLVQIADLDPQVTRQLTPAKVWLRTK